MTAVRGAAADGTACLVATHSAELAASCDRIVAIADGRLEGEIAGMLSGQPKASSQSDCELDRRRAAHRAGTPRGGIKMPAVDPRKLVDA